MPALKYYDLDSGTYKYVTGGMSQAAADSRYVQKSVFPNAAARNAAITSPYNGQVCYLTDINQQQIYRIGVNPAPTGWFPTGGVMPGGKVTFGSSSLSPGVGRINLTPQFSGPSVWGGISYSTGTGAFNLPYQGWYHINASVTFVTVGGNSGQAMIGDDAATVVVQDSAEGSWAQKTVTNEHFSVLSVIHGFAANSKVALWYNLPVSGSMARGKLDVHWLHS